MAGTEDLTGIDLDILDPTPDVHSLFVHYNALYFDGQLGACSVEWSTKRMTRCAGVCHYSRSGGCRIRLSEPLLKFRPTSDMKSTLLHEMIHANLFLAGVRDDGDHGPKFRAVMDRINRSSAPDPQRPPGGYNITVYHTMHDEVDNYLTHVWRCTVCGNVVKRAMNRPPQEADCRFYTKAAAGTAYCRDARCWYHSHLQTCGGAYVKIQEPVKQPANKEGNGGGGSSSTGNTAAAAATSKRARQAAAAAKGAPPITSFFAKERPPQQLLQQPQQKMQPPQQQLQQQQQRLSSSSSGSSASHAATVHLDPRAAAAAAAVARAAAAGSSGGGGVTASGGLSKQQFAHQLLPHSTGLSGRNSQQPPMQQQQQPPQPLLVPKGVTSNQLQNARGPLWSFGQQQHPAASRLAAPAPAAPADVVELLSSEDEDDAPELAGSPPSGADSFKGASRHRNGGASFDVVAVASGMGPLLPSAGNAIGAAGGGGRSSTVLLCPVCCLEFKELGSLNAHLDGCLL